MSEHRKRLEEALHSSVLDGLPDIKDSDAELAAVEIDWLIGYSTVCAALEKLIKMYGRIKPMCRRKDHHPLSSPQCIDCHLDARFEEASAALGEQKGSRNG